MRPSRVRALTGLTTRELRAAPSPEHVGKRLAEVVAEAGEEGEAAEHCTGQDREDPDP